MNKPKKKQYGQYKEERRQYAAAQSRAGRDIAPIPPVADLRRRIDAGKSFRVFCTTYFPAVFYLPWSEDHLRVIAKIERAVKTGGQFAHAMPRGSGKTALTEIACLWALFTGYRPYVCLIGANAERAKEMLDSIRLELENNDLLLADYPEIVYPIRSLERIHNRQSGQTYNGRPTLVHITQDQIVLPTMAGSASSGGIITVTGLKGGIRGQKHKKADGSIIRPSLVVIDDPQTSESAWSNIENEKRLALLAGDVLGMAGPGQKIAAILCCTVIRPGDMADCILNRDKHPQWQGERTKLVYAFPSDTALWDQYARIRTDSLKADGDGREATAFYVAHRKEMDAGAIVAWAERHKSDEASAIQHAMNLRFDNEAAFYAEYQNEPMADSADEVDITADFIAAKTNGRPRGQVPKRAEHVTAFIDVHDRLLYWAVAAWETDFTGYLIDYGTWPDQRRQFFTLRDARATLGRHYPGRGKEAAIEAGVYDLTHSLLAREFTRDNGTLCQIHRVLVDSGYTPEVVYSATRRLGRLNDVWPSRGVGIGPDNKPFSEYRRQPGEKYGHHWRIPSTRRTRELSTAHVDTNYWKSFLVDRLTTPQGDRGSLSLFGHDPADHRLLAEHLVAEYRTRTQGRGRTVDVWKPRASGFDNHWLDCLVGNLAAASTVGVALPGQEDAPGPAAAGRPVRLSDLQRRNT